MSKPIIIFPGDSRVCVLLGRQAPTEGKLPVRPSSFVIHRYVEGKYLLFHTLTRRAILMDPEWITYFMPGKVFSADVLQDTILQGFFEQYFLVPEDCNESELYQEIKDIIRLKEELPEGISNYVILPTTACNARCFYCFEQGMQYHTMSSETVSKLLQFMIDHKPADDSTIRVQWFGGEPLIGAGVISRICEGLKDAGIRYISSMISNGSLFTPQLIEQAVSLWNLQDVQITLDGREEEYLRRKQYVSSVKDPFRAVLHNAHALLAAGIQVQIRLNLDPDNIGELYRCVDFLDQEFGDPEERKLLAVYSHELFGKYCGGCDQSNELQTDMTVYVDQLNDYIARKGMHGRKGPVDSVDSECEPDKECSEHAVSEESIQEDTVPSSSKQPVFLPAIGMLKSTYCMADRAEHSAVIDAQGRLYTCEGMPDHLCYGDLENGITDPAHYEAITTAGELPEECCHCAYLPECTDFLLCPNREVPPRCKEQMKRKYDHDILDLYYHYMNRNNSRPSA